MFGFRACLSINEVVGFVVKFAVNLANTKADVVVWSCFFEPEVHDHGVVRRVGPSAIDVNGVVVINIRCIRVRRVAGSQPNDIASIHCPDVVAAFASEESVPSFS